MAVLTTKFSVGDVVWHAHTTTVQKQRPCPDCLGSKKWKCTSPAGGEFDVACPRCAASYQSDRDLSLTYSEFGPAAARLTIGLVKATTATGDDYDAGNTYMCHQTGIGSGSIYREAALFETEAEALTAAEAEAKLKNADPEGWVAKQYSKTVKFSDYELKDAVMEAAKAKATNALYAVSYLIEDIEQAETLEDVTRRIASWREEREAA